MKPLKRFFLYCFYCTVAYFTKGHPAHGAYKTWTTITQADSMGNHFCNVYTSDNIECTEISVGEANSEFEGYFSNACGSTGIRNIVYSEAVLCKTVEKNEDGKCTLTDCSWDCELSCATGSWGKTILYTEINDVCPSADEAGPACPENEKYSSTSLDGWCNVCPTGPDDDEHVAGTCNGGDSFECDDYPSLGKFYTPNKKENTCDRMCGGDGLYYDYLDQGRCLQCPSPMKECIGKYDSETSKTTVYATECNDGYYLDDGNCKDCPENSKTCDANGALSCNSSYYLVDKVCVKCPDNATCYDNGTYVCNNGFYKSNGACVTCPTNYKTCNNEGFTCKDGYYRSGDKCEQCQGGGVATCTADAATSCKENYFLNNGQCSDCPENATCDSDGFTCKDGYFKNDAGCTRCPDYADCTSGVFNGCWTDITGSITGSTGTDYSGSSGYSAYYYGDENGCYPCPDNALCYAGNATGRCQTGFYGNISGTGAVCTQCPKIGSGEYGDTNASSGAKTAAECFANVGKAYMYEDDYGQFYYASVNTQSSGTGSSDSSGYYTGGMCFYGGK
ncbi:MAG: hypothetical protein Q4C08_04385 [Pseudomonadota bacterium]|nr:hypothetical protein [Pseudomonadota bacterium]